MLIKKTFTDNLVKYKKLLWRRTGFTSRQQREVNKKCTELLAKGVNFFVSPQGERGFTIYVEVA